MLKAIALRHGVLAATILVGAAGMHTARAADPNPLDYTSGGPTGFVAMSDDTSIAITTCYPDDFDPIVPYPTILEMAGYENGSQGVEYDANGRPHCTGQTSLKQLRDWYADNSGQNPPNPPLSGDSDDGAMGQHYHASYFVIHASVRGTGCSGGEFDLFSTASADDGYDLIENYIVNDAAHPDWHSNGKVGIIGHSYSGLTGTLIAETRPPHLTAVSVSGLIDDLYRGITYPGGVFNGLFPPEWTLAVRPAYDVLGGSAQGVQRNLRDHPEIAEQCAANIASHRRTVLNDPLVQGTSQTDNDWWRARSLITKVKAIDRPFQVTGAFQDEQTGPRFQHFWEQIDGVPKRMLMTNGHHGTDVDPALIWKDRVAWLDHFMDIPNSYYGTIGFDPDDTPVSVRTLFELTNGNGTNEVKDSTSFPLPDTTWTPLYVAGVDAMTGSGTLSDSPAAEPGSASYLSGTKRQSWSYEADTAGPPATTRHLPDELELRYEVDSTMVIDGPITANLWLSTTGTDTDLFVQVIDEYAGKVSILQRGLLRASHASDIDLNHSDYFGVDPVDGGPFLYRPWRKHLTPDLVAPGSVDEYLVEIFPVAHVFRHGHTILVKLMAPPAVDSQYSYAPGPPGATVNTLYFSDAEPSRVTLPVLETPGFTVDATGPACGNYNSVRCLSE